LAKKNRSDRKTTAVTAGIVGAIQTLPWEYLVGAKTVAIWGPWFGSGPVVGLLIFLVGVAVREAYELLR